MKETIKHYFPLILSVLCATYAIYTIFHSLTEIGQAFETMSQKNHKSFVAQTIASQIEEEIPTPLYIEQSLIVGEEYFLEDLFELEFSNGSLIPFGADSDIALYLIDIKNANHTSILTKLSTENITSLNTIPSSAIYNTDKKLLYFYSSGIYTLYIRLYYHHHPGVLFECHIPVEVR